jgi:hypothetical protein
MRYTLTELSLEKTLKEFEYDWAMLLAKHQDQQSLKSDGVVLLEQMKSFTLQVENLVRQETDAWFLEFQSNIAGLEKMLKTEIETRKPGGIKVSVSNARDFDKVAIRLNEVQVAELAGVTERLVDSVPPGRHEIMAIGKKDDKELKATKVIEVKADSMMSVEMTLPAP